MTPEERRAKDAARKREAYARRKAALSPKPIFQSTPNPEAESAWKRVQTDGKPIPAKEAAQYVSNREKSEAIQADSTARAEYVNMLFSKYAKSTNLPELLQGLIREQIETRIIMTDLLAEILENTRK